MTTNQPIDYLTRQFSQEENLDLEVILRMLSEDQMLRHKVAKLIKQELKLPPEPVVIDGSKVLPSRLQFLFHWLVGYNPTFGMEPDQQKMLDRFCSPGGLQEIAAGVDKRNADILFAHIGLYTGQELTLKATGGMFGLTGGRVGAIRRQVVGALRRNMWSIDRAERLAQPDTQKLLGFPLEDLELAERTERCLRKAHIFTIGDLVARSEDDLMNITNFGMTGLAEVKKKLTGHGLSLKQ